VIWVTVKRLRRTVALDLQTTIVVTTAAPRNFHGFLLATLPTQLNRHTLCWVSLFHNLPRRQAVAITFESAIDDPGQIARSNTVGALFGLTPKKCQSPR
jgi:hypothetical protein